MVGVFKSLPKFNPFQTEWLLVENIFNENLKSARRNSESKKIS